MNFHLDICYCVDFMEKPLCGIQGSVLNKIIENPACLWQIYRFHFSVCHEWHDLL